MTVMTVMTVQSSPIQRAHPLSPSAQHHAGGLAAFPLPLATEGHPAMTAATFTQPVPEPEFLRVKEAMTVLRLGRTQPYDPIPSRRPTTGPECRARLNPVTPNR